MSQRAKDLLFFANNARVLSQSAWLLEKHRDYVTKCHTYAAEVAAKLIGAGV